MQIADFKNHVGETINVKGWVANKRTSKGLAFIILRDGSGFSQCVVSQETVNGEQFEVAKSLTLESSVEFDGTVVLDERQIGGYELQVTNVKLIAMAEDYPIAKKEHGPEFLADNRHLWLRSKRQWAIMRTRNRIIYAIHNFYQGEGFVQMDAPIFTGNACEGTTTLFETKFYGEPAYLTQSGQLYGEAMAMAMGKIYTFGPTFRAEQSKTRRHLSEFWMIEPEMAFFDLDMDMDLIEKFLKYVVNDILTNCKQELEILERDTTMLEKMSSNNFERITYTTAMQIVRGEMDINGRNTIKTLENDLLEATAKIEQSKSDIIEKEKALEGLTKGQRNFVQSQIDKLKNEVAETEIYAKNIPQWIKSAKNFEYGSDFGGSDETILTRMFDVPVMVYNWPHEIKAFYMKRTDDGKFAKGVDVLAPEGYGEIVGGGERETNLEWLLEKIQEHNLPMKAFEWYLDLRRYGSVPHAGFGLGLERTVAWLTGTKHIRETIPFPRMFGRIEP